MTIKFDGFTVVDYSEEFYYSFFRLSPNKTYTLAKFKSILHYMMCMISAYYFITSVLILLAIVFNLCIAKGSIIVAYSELSNMTTPKILKASDLKLEEYFKDQELRMPVSMAFLGPDDILVAEKETGKVKRIINHTLLKDPLLDLPVANKLERGLLGLAVSKQSPDKTYVFVYYTKSGGGKDGDNLMGVKPLGSYLERYELMGNKLLNPRLFMFINYTQQHESKLQSPSTGNNHVGGKMIIGPDNYLYLIVGDMTDRKTKTQNYANGTIPDGTGGILKFMQNGSAGSNALGSEWPLSLYYAFGIRNGFGLDFDPVTGNLWDTEVGTSHNDEINLVQPGFNSGWYLIQGLRSNQTRIIDPAKDLIKINGIGKYSDPELTWFNTITPVAIKFLDSDKLGKKYSNDLFVGAYFNGSSHAANLYHFDLKKDRQSLDLKGSLLGKMVTNYGDDKKAIFATGFGAITDMTVGPDGYLYILTLDSPGIIYRILPK